MKVAFIKSKEHGYLGISITGNGDADFCNSYSAELVSGGIPHTFESKDKALFILESYQYWYNSSIEHPMRNEFNNENCIVIEIELPED